jgi:iron complex transport system substrate-binding protein
MKRFSIVLLPLVCMLSITACSKAAEGGPSKSGTRIVTDVWGREVEIPALVETIVCLGSGAPRIAAYLDVVGMMAGVEEQDAAGMTVLRDYSPVHHEALKDLPRVGAGGGSGNNNGYPEEIITVSPDVILAGFSREAADELQTQTGIPVVSVRYISNGLANDSFYAAMRVFAETVGAQERCEAVLSFIDGLKADLNRRTSGIPAGEKPKAYTGAVTFNGRHGFAGTYSKFGPFTAVNALNVADEVLEEGYYETDLEKIIVWDPDVIFLDPGNMNLVNDEYAANPGYFRSVRAVREGRVYTMPSFNNMGMNISYALINAYYAGTVLFPGQFADVDIAEKAAEILTFFLGEDIYDVMVKGGLYYGTITIGKT